jgi:hypothetical protein
MKRPKCKFCKKGLLIPKALYQTNEKHNFCSMDCRIAYEKQIKENKKEI